MKKGDVVMIYEDPVTELKPEGKAELLKLISDDGLLTQKSSLQTWKVRFLDDEMVTTRNINVPVVPPKKMLKCDECGMEYSDAKDFAYAEKMRSAWAASQRAEGKEPRGICPCPSATCHGELVEKTK